VSSWQLSRGCSLRFAWWSLGTFGLLVVESLGDGDQAKGFQQTAAKLGLEGDPGTIPAGTPMGLDSDTVPERTLEAEEMARAEVLVDDSIAAFEVNSSFVVNVLLLALSLFFLGIATKLGRPKIQVAMIVVGMVLIAVSAV
jgi:hypothetical protein